MRALPILSVAVALFQLVRPANAEDWPMWGRDRTRNMVSPEKDPPTDWQVEKKNMEKVVRPGRNILWAVPVGSRSMGTPVVVNGQIWVGTNQLGDNGRDASVLKCFSECDGKLLYEYISPRLAGDKFGQNHDWPGASMASSPVIDGNRLWIRTNRCAVVCLDIDPLRRGERETKVLWQLDMIKELGVVPHGPAMGMGLTSSLGPAHRDLIHVITGNGKENSTEQVPAPEAPSLVCLNRDTGKVVWKDNSPGKNIMLGQYASPLVAEINGKTQVIVPLGDGWLYAFDPETGKHLWKCDLNPKDAKWEPGGRGTKNYGLGTPVLRGNRIYIGVGQDWENFEGLAWFYCIDPTKQGDISLELVDGDGKVQLNPNSGIVWRYGGPTTPKDREKLKRDYYFGRTLSTCAVVDSLVYITELAGYLHCLDARCGKRYWTHDLKTAVCASPLWVDGKIYVGTEDGTMFIYDHGTKLKEPKVIDMERPITASPVYVNGVLYVLTESMLYAIREKK
jgi:outer membrane protein assembly factor BamB